jgi:hypothetical protein
MNEPVHIISLGAGVQSSCLALMAARGEVGPMPTAAIFADTQDEPASVYEYLDWIEKQLPFPVYRVTAGRLSEAATRIRVSKKGNKYTQSGIPVFITEGIAQRQCTADFKITPIRKKCRELCGKGGGVIQWIGISLDEVSRMKPSRDKWCNNRWPLIEKEMTRHDCLRWIKTHGYKTPSRSACRYCPYKSNHEWSRLKANEPIEFAKAVEFEAALQASYAQTRNKGVPYLHRSLVPLGAVDLSTDVDRGQVELGFHNECEGMCGV